MKKTIIIVKNVAENVDVKVVYGNRVLIFHQTTKDYKRVCDSYCVNPELISRRLDYSQLYSDEPYEIQPVYYTIDICMDSIPPQYSTKIYYSDYSILLKDIYDQLEKFYNDHDNFIQSWSELCSQHCIYLSIMSRDTESGLETILFGFTELDVQNVQVMSYDSSSSYRATSHMIFYSLIGFGFISLFTIFIVIKIVHIMRKIQTENKHYKNRILSNLNNVSV